MQRQGYSGWRKIAEAATGSGIMKMGVLLDFDSLGSVRMHPFYR